MIRIQVPATSANVAVGFDSLALAFNRYNIFGFEPSDNTQFIGFSDQHSSPDNLVFQAYKAFAESHTTVQPVTITLEHSDIPESRGLGSSASCILAGVLAANEIHNLQKTTEECVKFAAEFEGHPDNVYAAMYGSLTAVMKDGDMYFHQTFDVSDTLQFMLCIPETKGQTKSLRQALPLSVPLPNAVFQLSRMIHVPHAFHTADMKLLKAVLQDTLHEDFRYPSIPNFRKVMALRRTLDGVITISGSGPSLLVISKQDVTDDLSELHNDFTFYPVQLSSGAIVEVIS